MKHDALVVNNPIYLDYHLRQFKEPHRSTVHFFNWLEELGVLSRGSEQNILDACTGCGAVLLYARKEFPSCSFTGIDINDNFIKKGNELLKDFDGIHLERGNLFRLNKKFKNKFDGVTCLQSLPCFKNFEKPLNALVKMNPKWLAFSILLNELDINYVIKIHDFINPTRKEESYYNVWSLNRVKSFLESKNYGDFQFKKFEIDVDLPEPIDKLGTYTVKKDDGTRLQVSGALVRPWYFICVKRLV